MQITTMVCSQEFRNCNNLIHISDALSVSIISEQFLTDKDSITASGSDPGAVSFGHPFLLRRGSCYFPGFYLWGLSYL